MKPSFLISVILLLAVSILPACGGGHGGGGADPNAPATVAVNAKTLALANGSDVVTVQADVRKADGTVVGDGTMVSFSVNTATLSVSTAATTSGIASVTMTSPAIPGANNYTATVTATTGGVSGTRDVKFINQPTSVDVFVRFDTDVTDLAALQFIIKNTPGATFDNSTQLIARLNNAAAGSSSIILAGFNAAAGSLTIGLANPNGFHTGTTPIIKATYAIATGAGLPAFSVDPAPGSFTAANQGNSLTTPPVTAANLVISTVLNTE
jgi:hypothetical protein